MDIDDPLELNSLLPTFSQPRPSLTTDPDPAEAPVSPASPPPQRRRSVGVVGLDEPTGPRPDDQLTPTGTSSASKPTPAQTTRLVVGLLGLAAAAAAGLIRWRLQRRLRQPTRQEKIDIAAPLARIGLRHADLSWLNADLADLLDAGTATGVYLTDGPLLLPLEPDAGVPADLQETYQ